LQIDVGRVAGATFDGQLISRMLGSEDRKIVWELFGLT
jgi:hypothetical protein